MRAKVAGSKMCEVSPSQPSRLNGLKKNQGKNCEKLNVKLPEPTLLFQLKSIPPPFGAVVKCKDLSRAIRRKAKRK